MPSSQSQVSRFFLIAVQFLLIGLVCFSIIRNIRGLTSSYPGIHFSWQLLIAVTITLASLVLAGASVLKSLLANKPVRILLFLTGICFSVVSFKLSYAGLIADANGKFNQSVLDAPEVVILQSEISDIIERQSVYGITRPEKLSLLAREKELRAELREAKARARSQASIAARRANKTSGREIAYGLFAALPELGIIVFTLVMVLLSGQAIGSSVQSQTHAVQLAPSQWPELSAQIPTPQLAPPGQSGYMTSDAHHTTQAHHRSQQQISNSPEIINPESVNRPPNQREALEDNKNGKADAPPPIQQQIAQQWQPFN